MVVQVVSTDEMRILIFQTPKLTYVQTLEYLLRETAEQKVDLAVLPEFSLEHPAQCTNQSELSYDNVSIMMLSRLAKQRQLYLVLGSVEERCPVSNHVYDTCVVFNRSGEMILQYRKGSNSVNYFQSEFGMIGVLLGAEVEDESRWPSLLAQCVVILNPCNAPMELDQALAKAHPESFGRKTVMSHISFWRFVIFLCYMFSLLVLVKCEVNSSFHWA